MHMGAHRGRRIILADDLAEADVAECATLMNAEQVRATTASVEIGLTREVTWHVAGGYYLHFGREHPIGVGFVFTSGPTRDGVTELTAMLQEYFEPPSDGALVAAVDAAVSAEHRRTALVRLGVGAPEGEVPGWASRIVTAMRADDARVREGGLWAAAHVLWPGLLAEVESMSTTDADPLLRDQAGALAGFMRQEGIVP
ncbi:hypothetical protein [Kribbella sp. CA-247076]|uniref:hypothetical protein n=1 Tax=Kribbella sp. CA-247076 TaxID=3239941 RepID=UPI003D9269D7